MHTLLQDLRYSARQLIRSPGFTLTAVISLALGIGAATAVFSVIYAVLLSPYPYPAVDRIVRLTTFSLAGSGDPVFLNGAQIQTLRQSPVVESVLAVDSQALMLTGQDLPENVRTASLTSNSFQDLGVPAVQGRGLWPSDAVDGQEPRPVAVLSYRFWRKHFFSNPGVIGRTLQLDHKNFEIVGVAASRFTWYDGDVYLPLKLMREPGRTCIVNLLLRPGVSRAAADAALQPLVEQFAKYMPNDFPDVFKVHVLGLNDWVVGTMGGTLYLVFGAVMLLLVIGCGNVSILLLARGAARQHELAVRSAIGAGRFRIIRQLLTDSLLLALLGAVLGVLTSYGALALIQNLLPPLCIRFRSRDSHQPARAIFQRDDGARHGRAVRALARAAALTNAYRPDYAVRRTSGGGHCSRTPDPWHADRRAGGADITVAGSCRLINEGIHPADPPASRLRSAQCDGGGNSFTPELLSHMGRACRLL